MALRELVSLGTAPMERCGLCADGPSISLVFSGVPEEAAVGRRKGPSGANSLCGQCGTCRMPSSMRAGWI